MRSIDEGLRDLFILALFLIAVAYFVGFGTELRIVFAGLGNLLTIGQGRITSGPNAGQFAGYPQGA